MATSYDEGIEAARQDFPEVVHQPAQGQYAASPYGYPQSHHSPGPWDNNSTLGGNKPEQSPPSGYTPVPSAYPPTSVASPYPQSATPANTTPGKKSSGGVFGCTLLTFILWCIIAMLSAAVIGLAAGTGVEASRANDAETKVQALSASLASMTASPTCSAPAQATQSFNDIDRGCSNSPNSVTKTNYTSFPFDGAIRFTISCNRDINGNPVLKLFTADFDTCMDACASYTVNMPGVFGNTANATCGGVSFIPLWTNKTAADAGGAPGNCYLKPSTVASSDLFIPTIGTECHAALVS